MPVNLKKDGFAFSEVVEILTTLFNVHPDRRDTFVSRLQQLQKSGLPGRANVGKGTNVRYVNWQLADLSLLLHLLDCGITPGTLKEYFRPLDENYIGVFSLSGQGVIVQSSLGEGNEPIYLLIRFNSLKYLTTPRNEGDGAHPLDRVDYGRSGENVLEELGDGPALAIDLTALLSNLRTAVHRTYPDRMEDITFYPTRSGQKDD